MKQLKDLTKEEYNRLNKSGMLFEIYPEAEGLYIDDCEGQLEPLIIRQNNGNKREISIQGNINTGRVTNEPFTS